MFKDETILEAIKNGFWYKDGDEIRKCSPSIDLFKIGYNCKEDAEHYGMNTENVGFFFQMLNPIRNEKLIFNKNNYGVIWALTREELVK